MKKIRAFCEKSREVLSYLFFGVMTTLLNIVLYSLFQIIFGYQAANSWGNILNNVLCILFAYSTNRRWVFASKTHGRAALNEFARFVTCRLGTMLLDTAIMVVLGNWIGPALIDKQWLNLWGVGVKITANAVVVVLNYIFSKKIIFKKDEKTAKAAKKPTAAAPAQAPAAAAATASASASTPAAASAPTAANASASAPAPAKEKTPAKAGKKAE